LETKGLHRPYWLLVAASALMGAGFADFPLIAYHFQQSGTLPATWIPLFYALAMGVDALAALALGRLFDHWGMVIIIAGPVLAAPFAPLVFLGGVTGALLGMIFWGIGMGALESVMKAAVAAMVPRQRRATGFGVFHTCFGFCWFLGSALMGLLYEVSLTALIVFSVALQLLSIPLFILLSRDVSLRPPRRPREG
jgi:MFS family permease